MKRFLSTLAAVLLMLAGVAAAALGGLGLSVFGTDGTYTAQSSAISSSEGSLALVADLAGVEIDIPYHDLLGEATITAVPASSGGTGLFIGHADQAAVDTYLFGAPYDLAAKNGEWTTTQVPGIEAEIQPPQEAGFWSQSAVGDAPAITLDPPDALQTLVIMNADATPGINVDLTLGFAGDQIFAYAVGSIVIGALLILFGMAIVAGGRRRRKKVAGDARENVVSFSDLQHPSDGESSQQSAVRDDAAR